MVRLEDLTPGVRVAGILPGAVRIASQVITSAAR
jgi:hypothetical protein